jgi:hypothetical protein
MYSAVKEESPLILWLGSPVGGIVFVILGYVSVDLLYEEGELAQLGEEAADVVVHDIITVLFCHKPDYWEWQGAVNCEKVICFRYCGSNWFFRDLNVRIVVR